MWLRMVIVGGFKMVGGFKKVGGFKMVGGVVRVIPITNNNG